MTSRVDGLHEVVREAGLAGRVQVGVTSNPLIRLIKPEVERAPRPELDALLGLEARPGQGRLIELAGTVSSGRTALAYRLAAGTTRRGELSAWVDLPDALDPRFLRRSGVDLASVLWVRPPDVRAALRSVELLIRTGFATVALDLEGASPKSLARLGPPVWTRLLRVVRRARATVVLLAPPDPSDEPDERLAGAATALGLYTERSRSVFEHGLFEGLEISAAVVRNRAGPTGAELPLRLWHRPGSTLSG